MDVEAHVIYNIANAAVRTYPFPHFFVHPVFPPAFYKALRAALPPTRAYKRLEEGGTLIKKGTYQERFFCSLSEAAHAGGSDGPLSQMAEWMHGDRFARLVLHKFDQARRDRYGDEALLRITSDARLVRDFSNYAIAPHTDTPSKLVSLLFYLPPDDSKRHLGTSIYVPRDPTVRCEGTRHHPFEPFKLAATMEYLPNSLFAFFKTDAAFHGVEPISEAHVERDLLLYNVYLKKLVLRAPPQGQYSIRSAPVWPWEQDRDEAPSEAIPMGAR